MSEPPVAVAGDCTLWGYGKALLKLLKLRAYLHPKVTVFPFGWWVLFSSFRREFAGNIGGFCYTIMLMHVKLKIIAIAVTGLIVASIAYLYITRNNAVIYRYGDRASEQNAFLIQNPFRERGPEDEAEKILQELKGGSCERALALPAVDPATIGDKCKKEAVSPLQNWSILDRHDIGSQVILVYKVYRSDANDTSPGRTQIFPGLAWIDVEKTGEDRWRALSYQTYY